MSDPLLAEIDETQVVSDEEAEPLKLLTSRDKDQILEAANEMVRSETHDKTTANEGGIAMTEMTASKSYETGARDTRGGSYSVTPYVGPKKKSTKSQSLHELPTDLTELGSLDDMKDMTKSASKDINENNINIKDQKVLNSILDDAGGRNALTIAKKRMKQKLNVENGFCPKGHNLKIKTVSQSKQVCDYCHDFIDIGTKSHGCHKSETDCNFDLCSRCMLEIRLGHSINYLDISEWFGNLQKVTKQQWWRQC